MESNEGILLTDIDMIATKVNFFEERLHEIEDTKFVNFCPRISYKKGQMLSMCYNIATSETWKKLFKYKLLLY